MQWPALAALFVSACWLVLPYLGMILAVVVVHELGHYWAGRAVGARVEAFGVGFGPELVGFTDRHGVRWRFCAFPLGGYVRFAGDADVASRPDYRTIDAMDAVARRGLLAAMSAPRRAFVYAAGPGANVVLAFLILSMTFLAFGRQDYRPVVVSVVEGSPAALAGIRPADEFVAIDGTPTPTFRDVKDAIQDAAGRPMLVEIERDGVVHRGSLAASFQEVDGPFGHDRQPLIGIKIATSPAMAIVQTFGPAGAAEEGLRETWRVARMTVVSVVNVIAGRASLDNLSGPVKMAKVSDVVARNGGWRGFLGLLAVVSVSLAIANLMPIPVLDGGHLLLIGVECIIGRPIPYRLVDAFHRVGFACLSLIIIAITANDLLNVFG